MIYVALLRGINVGGKNKIDMKQLKETFEQIGMKAVVTYINSGNVIFNDDQHTVPELTDLIETAIKKDFHFDIRVLIRSIRDLENTMKSLPESWKNDEDMKCDILFPGEEFDRETVLDEMQVKPFIDTVIYTPGAILWSVARKDVTRSGIVKIVGSSLYKSMTVRNVNTFRKLYAIMCSQAEIKFSC